MLIPASAAWAADATGCSGSVESFRADGTSLDMANLPGEGGTASDPFVIDPDGSVLWSGSTDELITDGSWAVRIGGVQVLSGEAPNGEQTQSAEGEVDLSGVVVTPVAWLMQTSARVPVEGELTGNGGTCAGSGYIAGAGGSTLTSPITLAGAGLTVLGAAMIIGVSVGTKAVAAGEAGGATQGGAS